MAATTETILGVFAHVDTTVRALEGLKAKGYHDLTVYTPIPVHEIEDVVEPQSSWTFSPIAPNPAMATLISAMPTTLRPRTSGLPWCLI